MSAARRPDPRRAAIAKVQIARKELGLDEAAYRALLERLTGRRSAADCTATQLGRVLEELKAKGWKPAYTGRAVKAVWVNESPSIPPAPRLADSPVARKARALWISLHQLGAVRDPSERALEAFAARQLGVDRLQWADQSQGYRLIEALKAMAERAGWSQDLAGVEPADHTATLKRRLEAAIAARAERGQS